MTRKQTNIIDFNQVIDNIQIGVARFVSKGDFSIVFANEYLAFMLGYTKKELTKLSLKALMVDLPKYQIFCKTILKVGEIKRLDVKIKGKGKQVIWCSLSARGSKNAEGKFDNFDVCFQDISKRKRQEAELAESKEMFLTLFNNTAAAVVITDNEEKIMAWNSLAQELFKYEKVELFNMPIKELYSSVEWKKIKEARKKRKDLISNINSKVVTKDKKVLDAAVSVSIMKNSEGAEVGSISIIRDVTEQKIAERKIIDSENKIRVILDNSAAAITMTDDQERIVSWNRYTEVLLGMSKKDLQNAPIQKIYPEDEWKKIRAANIRELGAKHRIETKVKTLDGRIIDIDLSVNILRDSDGHIVGSVGIMQDITEQKHLQDMLMKAKLAAEDANSAKSLFLANMSHEVRTPMNAILGMIDLTLDTQLTDEQKDNLLVAKDAADNLLGLLNDILDLSRVEAGKITLESIEFQLPNVIDSVIKGLSVIAKGKKLNLNLIVEEGVPELIEGDPVRIRQVLINLINNAIKFTHAGTITTVVKCVANSKNQVTIQFSVIDEGIGIPKNRQEKVFEVFSQADDSTTRKFGGTGLGLAISKRLVEMMQGKIWVDSEEGKGSTFSFTAVFKLLAMKEDKSSLRMNLMNASGSDEVLKNLKILLAEDNMVNQKIAMKMLEKVGCIVSAVENGQEVLDALEKHAYDLILMDAQMPKLDGLETTRLIRSNEKTTGKHVPIIALTARAMHEDRKKCLDIGMDGYVSKPIDRKLLFAEITNLFKKG